MSEQADPSRHAKMAPKHVGDTHLPAAQRDEGSQRTSGPSIRSLRIPLVEVDPTGLEAKARGHPPGDDPNRSRLDLAHTCLPLGRLQGRLEPFAQQQREQVEALGSLGGQVSHGRETYPWTRHSQRAARRREGATMLQRMPILRFDKRDLSQENPRAFTHPITVRFQDVDAAGIVFFARIAEYFHDGYFAFLTARGGLDLPEAMRSAPWVAPMLHLECDFFAPLRFGDRCAVEVVRGRIEAADLCVGMRMVRTSGRREGEVVAVAQQAHRIVDRERFEPCAVPEGFRRAVESL